MISAPGVGEVAQGESALPLAGCAVCSLSLCWRIAENAERGVTWWDWTRLPLSVVSSVKPGSMGFVPKVGIMYTTGLFLEDDTEALVCTRNLLFFICSRIYPILPQALGEGWDRSICRPSEER